MGSSRKATRDEKSKKDGRILKSNLCSEIKCDRMKSAAKGLLTLFLLGVDSE